MGVTCLMHNKQSSQCFSFFQLSYYSTWHSASSHKSQKSRLRACASTASPAPGRRAPPTTPCLSVRSSSRGAPIRSCPRPYSSPAAIKARPPPKPGRHAVEAKQARKREPVKAKQSKRKQSSHKQSRASESKAAISKATHSISKPSEQASTASKA